MIQKLQKTFHTDKWWGKTIFIILTYVLYWCIFYGSWFLIPYDSFNKNTDISGILFLIYSFIIIPILSFFIPYFIKKILNINKIFLYILHIFLILLSVWFFIHVSLIIAFKHFSIG